MNLNKFKLKNVNFLKLTKVVLGNYFKKTIKEIGYKDFVICKNVNSFFTFRSSPYN